MAAKNVKSKQQNHQLKITLTEENYNKLKESAGKNYRTISQEVNYRLNQLLSRPGGLDSPAPIYFPPGVREPLPTPPMFIPHNTPRWHSHHTKSREPRPGVQS